MNPERPLTGKSERMGLIGSWSNYILAFYDLALFLYRLNTVISICTNENPHRTRVPLMVQNINNKRIARLNVFCIRKSPITFGFEIKICLKLGDTALIGRSESIHTFQAWNILCRQQSRLSEFVVRWVVTGSEENPMFHCQPLLHIQMA